MKQIITSTSYLLREILLSYDAVPCAMSSYKQARVGEHRILKFTFTGCVFRLKRIFELRGLWKKLFLFVLHLAKVCTCTTILLYLRMLDYHINLSRPLHFNTSNTRNRRWSRCRSLLKSALKEKVCKHITDKICYNTARTCNDDALHRINGEGSEACISFCKIIEISLPM